MEDREAECRFGYEDVARHRYIGIAGRIRPALVVARDDDALGLMLEHDLSRTQDMAGRDQAQRSAELLQGGLGQAFDQRLAVIACCAFGHDQQVMRRA